MISCSAYGWPALKRVAGARVVHVVALVVGNEPVVGGVVDAPERQRRAEVVALGRVVVDDVEDHLDARLVQRHDHLLELGDLLAALAAPRVVVVRREEADRVVAPVVAQALLDEVRVVHELVHGQQLDGRDAERRQVADRRRMGEAGVRAAQLLGDVRVAHREALDVRLVDDRLVQRPARRAVRRPVEVRVDDDRARHERRAVGVVDDAIWVARSGTRRRPRSSRPRPRWRGRTGRAAASTAGSACPARVPRAVDAKAVALAGLESGHVAVANEAGLFGQSHAGLVAVVVEEAQLDRIPRPRRTSRS